MFPNEIPGDGLTLRMLTPADGPALLRFVNLPDVMNPTSSEGWTEESMATFLADNVTGAAEGKWCRYAILPSGHVDAVGSVGLFMVEARYQRAEIGYDLSPEWWGKGVMSKAAETLIQWAFANGFHRIDATVMVGNERSEHVLTRLGFTREGQMADYKLVRGEWKDYTLWGRVNR